jgi:hypothetical protein
MHGAVPEGASLGTTGGLPCLDVGTGKSRPVVAKDGIARWLERRTTQSTTSGGVTTWLKMTRQPMSRFFPFCLLYDMTETGLLLTDTYHISLTIL